MKPIFKLAGAALLALGIASGAQAKDIIVATDTAFVPFEFKEGDKYTGFDIDLWDAISKEIGQGYELRQMDFAGIIPALQTGQIDAAIAGITITDERKNAVDFSDPYYDSGLQLMVPADSAVTGVADLNGKTLAVKTGTSSEDYAKKSLPDTTLRQFPNIDNAYLEVRTGNVDAALHDLPNVLYYIKTAGNGQVKAVGDKLEGQQYGIAFPKNSELPAKVNEALAKLKADGRYDAIYEKWFGTKPAK